tara:strand:- start:376 stop:1752 length:1377 start_codon:yes stop_codon:yes gene_type:complete
MPGVKGERLDEVGSDSIISKFEVKGVGSWELDIPHTVYPPREDTNLLAGALLGLTRHGGLATEIGCGSGAISILLATLGWKVEACDVNPFAVAATRGNSSKAGLSNLINVIEGGPGEEGWSIPEDSSLIVWNLPYLSPPEDGEPVLEAIEEASLSDLADGGWSNLLLSELTSATIRNDCLVVMLHRTDPPSPSNPENWKSKGWSSRLLASSRIADEGLKVISYWIPGSGTPPIVLEECESTMDEAGKISEPGWQRVLSLSQVSGRGRRGNSWQSESGDMACTWLIPSNVVEGCSAGLTQTAIGAVVSEALRCNVKWPNDILTDDGAKLGGVLLEGSTEDSRVKVGIGLNRKGGSLDGVRIAGWEDAIGPSRTSEVFEMVDAAVASLFEERPSVPPITRDELLLISWRGLSESLSHGTHVSRSGSSIRPVGLTEDGHLILHCESGVETVDEMDSLSWVT